MHWRLFRLFPLFRKSFLPVLTSGLSQKALAEQLQLAGYELSDLTVLRIEKGTRFVPDYELVALAEFFHVSCEYLLGVQDKK